MTDPKDILATKIIPNVGVKILVRVPNSKPKWVWRDKVEKPSNPPINSFDEYLTK